MNEINHEMIKAAMNRTPVYVKDDELPRRHAVLIAWEPMSPNGKRKWRRARVEYASGKRATISTDRIELVHKPTEVEQ